MKIVELEGTRRQIGEAMGEGHRAEIGALYDARVQNAIAQARLYGRRRIAEADLIALAERCLPFVREFDPPGCVEMEGVAAGADRTLAQIWLMNALTDVRDLAAYGEQDWMRPLEEGCSAILVGAGRGGGRTLAAQTWDLATDNMPFVRLVVRRPAGEPATASMTLVGCASLIGINDRGVAIGTTNVRATDNRLGVGYLDVIHRALHCASSEEAVEVVRSAPRAGAHFYHVTGPESDPVRLECSAHVVEHGTVGDVHVQTNHMLQSRTRALEVTGTPTTSSHARYRRLQSLVADAPALDVPRLKRFLADRDGGENAVDRHDFGGISTNGAVVMEPATRTLHVVWGSASRGRWIAHMLPPPC